MPLVEGELRRLATACMQRELPGHTLQASALINEVYLRFAGGAGAECANRAHFYALAARTMRRILVDYARARQNAKRGGSLEKVSLERAFSMPLEDRHDFMGLDEALQQLELIHPRQAQVVELRFFGGFTADEVAEALQISKDTVKRDWRFAKLWLLRELQGTGTR